jgi:hypothetical protein
MTMTIKARSMKIVSFGPTLALAMALQACSTQDSSSPKLAEAVEDYAAQAVVEAPASAACSESANLLGAPNFGASNRVTAPWTFRQHSAQPSFVHYIQDGVLRITQEGTEPWYIVNQTITDPRLAGATVRYRATLKLAVVTEPPAHGFEHYAGLFLAPVSRSGKAFAHSMAEHEPNKGDHDWVTVSIEKTLPDIAQGVQAGFVHQAMGTIEAKNPELVIVSCP